MPLGYRARFIDLGTLEKKEKTLEYNSVLNESEKKDSEIPPQKINKIVLRLTALLGALDRLPGSGCVPLAPLYSCVPRIHKAPWANRGPFLFFFWRFGSTPRETAIRNNKI